VKKWILLPAIVLGAALVGLGTALAQGEGSVAMRVATLVLKAGGKPLADTEATRTKFLSRTYPSPAPIPASLAKKVNVTKAIIGGHKVLTLVPTTNASTRHVIYYHGGAYVNDMLGPHWDIVGALIDATGATVTVPIYPLAPEKSNRPAFAFLADVYRDVLTKAAAGDVVLAGDSAGGGLALGQAIEFRDQKLPLPGRIILFSPWLDLTLADPEARKLETKDVMLAVDALRMCGAWWAGGDDPRLPRLSPLYADLEGLPPIELYQGTNDIFVVDSRTFVKKVQAAGGAIHYGEYPGAFHVFVGATFTPEAKDVFGRIAASSAQASGKKP
jgi:monoterpene epsilon-lactone hydrolase